jgi:2'-5' RNA ligase
MKPFTMFWSGFGAFPDFKRPKVIWTGATRGGDTLESLHTLLESHLTALGFPAEQKKFKPHLTIGRVKSPGGLKDLIAIIEKIKHNKIGEMEVSSFSLLSSTLTPRGPIYRELSTFTLSGEYTHEA